MTSLDVTTTGFDQLARDLEAAASDVTKETRQVVSKGCLNIKKDWAKRWTGLAHAPDVGRSINYDVTTTGDLVTGEVGPDKDKRQGALGNLLEYGSIHNAPIPGGIPALAAEEARFAKSLERVGAALIERDTQ